MQHNRLSAASISRRGHRSPAGERTAPYRIGSPRRAQRRVVLLCGLAVLAGGCCPPRVVHTPHISSYSNPIMATGGVRRVLFLPIENGTPYAEAAPRLQQALTAELRSAGMFEIVDPAAVPPQLLYHPPLLNGRFDEQVLSDMLRRFHIDAVAFCRLTDYHPYWPPRVGLTLHIVDARESVTLASVDGMWDARNNVVACQARDDYTTLTPDDTIPHDDLILYSPEYFSKFVARQAVFALNGSRCTPPDVITQPVHAVPVPDHVVRDMELAGARLRGKLPVMMPSTRSPSFDIADKKRQTGKDVVK